MKCGKTATERYFKDTFKPVSGRDQEFFVGWVKPTMFNSADSGGFHPPYKLPFSRGLGFRAFASGRQDKLPIFPIVQWPL